MGRRVREERREEREDKVVEKTKRERKNSTKNKISIMKSILFFLTIVIVFSNENNTYTFKTQYHKGEIVKYRTESMLDFNFGSFSNQNNSDYKMTEKYMGEKDGFILIGDSATLLKICNGIFVEIKTQAVCMIGKKK